MRGRAGTPAAPQLSSPDAVSGDEDRRPVLAVRGLAKAFGETHALRDCSLTLRAGEIHCLAGENGSGKSTLVKVLGGVHVPDAGELRLDDEVLERFGSPAASRRNGIAIVYQEVGRAHDQTVLDNLWLGAEGLLRGRISAREKAARAQPVVERLLGHPLDLSGLVEDLTLSERQACTIVRALLREPRLLVLDEATSALDVETRDRLFTEIGDLRARGVAIVLITHRMDEVALVADRITVLRSGRTVGELERAAYSPDAVVELMTGGVAPEDAMSRQRRVGAPEERPVALRARLGPRAATPEVTFRAGEVVGVAGLEGQRQEDFLELLAGLRTLDGAEVEVVDGDETTPVAGQADARRARIAYLPRDRGGESAFAWMSILRNYALPTLEEDRRRGLLSARSTGRRFTAVAERLHLRYGDGEDAITTLSGGNQQKVMIARWLAARPRVLLLNDPTRGIDIGAKLDVYRLLGELVEDDVTVVLLSTETEELLALSDRVLVFREGALAAELHADDLTSDALVSSYFGR